MRNLDYAIVFVSDMKRSIAFYHDLFGLDVKFESPHWTELVSGQYTIALHHSSPAAPPASTDHPGHCQLGFKVPDLDAFHRDATQKGARCLRAPADEGFGKLAVYADPDGLGISVMQPKYG